MTGPIANNNISLASNNIPGQAQDKPKDAKGFETYIVDAKTPEKPATKPANSIVKGAESLTSYLGSLKALSENQQF